MKMLWNGEFNEVNCDDIQHYPLSSVIEAEATTTVKNLLPEKSQAKYMSIYTTFMQWRKEHNINSFSEDVLLNYFTTLSENYKPSTLWAHYSMLKSTINANNNIDIGTYTQLIAFIKKENSGFQCKKSKVFTSKDISKFLNEAPDCEHLATKVILILGILGACRSEELCNITMKNISDYGEMYLVKIPKTESNHPRSFTIEGEFYNIVKKYSEKRPKDPQYQRFLMNYQNGKCTHQYIGRNKIGAAPKKIAEYLNLPEPENYTGHSFRRTSVATSLAISGADVTTLNRLCKRKSNVVTEEYIQEEDPISIEGELPLKITELMNSEASTSVKRTKIYIEKNPKTLLLTNNDNEVSHDNNIILDNAPSQTINLAFTNCSNITIVCNRGQKNME